MYLGNTFFLFLWLPHLMCVCALFFRQQSSVVCTHLHISTVHLFHSDQRKFQHTSYSQCVQLLFDMLCSCIVHVYVNSAHFQTIMSDMPQQALSQSLYVCVLRMKTVTYREQKRQSTTTVKFVAHTNISLALILTVQTLSVCVCVCFVCILLVVNEQVIQLKCKRILTKFTQSHTRTHPIYRSLGLFGSECMCVFSNVSFAVVS